MNVNMGIIKLEVSLPEAAKAIEEFRKNRIQALEAIGTKIKTAVSTAFNHLLKSEMTLFLGTPDQDDNKKNGYQKREYALKGIGCIRIRMPVDRKHRFESNISPVSDPSPGKAPLGLVYRRNKLSHSATGNDCQGALPGGTGD